MKEMNEVNGRAGPKLLYIENQFQREAAREREENRGRQVAESVTCCKFDLDLCVFLFLLLLFVVEIDFF